MEWCESAVLIIACAHLFLNASSVQSLSFVWLFETPWTAALQAFLSITNSWSLLKLVSIELVMPSNHLILYRPLLLLPSVFPSIRVFSSESVLHIMWPKYLSFSFSISPSNEYSGPISFRIEGFDILAVQGALRSLLQHHTSKASILQHSAFFIFQLSHPYMTTGKIIALTKWTLLAMSLIFNTLSRLIVPFLPRSRSLLISWLQTPSEMILEPLKIKSLTVSIVSHLFAMKWWDQMPWSSFSAHISVLLSVCPILSFAFCVHKCVLYICVSLSALQIGSSVPFF